MIEYSRNREYDNKLLSQCVSNELITIASTQGVSIFDLQIIEAFVYGIDFSRETWSILYPKGYEGLYTLISIKKIIDGDLLESLNDTGLSLKQIGDFVDSVAFEAEEKSLSNEEITARVDTFIEEIKKFQQEQEQEHIEPVIIKPQQQIVAPVYGGKNNHKSKHNAKYRKKYKKFVSKYIIKKKKKQNKTKNKSTRGTNTKNKTKKNKKIAKNKSKYTKKTLKNKNKNKNKNKKRNHMSNHKSKHNKKANTNYYNLYKHNKTLKH